MEELLRKEKMSIKDCISILKALPPTERTKLMWIGYGIASASEAKDEHNKR